MGGEKKPLVMSDLGCADGCGRQMGAGNCADGCGRRGCNGVSGNGWGEEGAGDERPTAADGVGATEWLEMGGEKKPLVMSDLEVRGRLRTANGCGELRAPLRTAWVQGGDWKFPVTPLHPRCGELRGRLRTAWVQGGGWKWVGRKSRW